MKAFVPVVTDTEVVEGRGTLVDAKGFEIALFRYDGRIYAIDRICLHRGGSLDEGEVEGEVVTCPLHGWPYNFRTGEFEVNPAIKVATYPVKVQDGQVFVEIDGTEGDGEHERGEGGL